MDDIRPPKSGKNKQAAKIVREPQYDHETLPEPVFESPEAIASSESAQESVSAKDSSKTPKKSGKSKKKKLIIIGAIIGGILLIGGIVGAWWTISHRKPPADNSTGQKTVYKAPEPPKPTTEPSYLTGIDVAVELNKRAVTGIMIENSPDARPQSGLLEAGIIYEAIAEGGITRFLTLFQEAQPQYIGPVRSVRPYYLDYVTPYDAAITHAGGSGEALAQIRNEGLKDLDHGANGNAFQRISSRFAPHNLYTSFKQLDEASQKRGYTSSSFTNLQRKPDNGSKAPTATSMDFTISSFLYSPHYDYNATTNKYKRSQGGKPHVDDKSGEQLQPKVVVALVVPYGISADRIHSEYKTNGSGKAFVFQDGTVVEATWTKSGRKDQLLLKDSTGKILKINAGQTWFSLVASADLVKFTGPPAPAAPATP